MRNRRSWGYIADISTNTSENAHTPYLFTAVARMVYIRDGETEFSFAWARVPTYSSNVLTSADVPLPEGTPTFGITLPTFGGYLGATFSTREVGALPQWRPEGLGPAVFTSDVDLDPWSWAPLPALGASGFFTKKTSPRITGLRLKPPILEVRQYSDKATRNFRESATLSL